MRSIRFWNNRRLLPLLLVLSIVSMATASGASWQCLDGHKCPPGCTMLHESSSSSEKPEAVHHACCLETPKATSGSSCPNRESLTGPKLKKGCTSPTCVLRIMAKPDAAASPHVTVLSPDVAVLVPLVPTSVITEETKALFVSSPRAPPRSGICRLLSSRAPPSLI